MFIFSISLFLLFTFSTQCMETPLGKRKGSQVEHTSKCVRFDYGTPTLVGIPADITKLILEYVISGNCVQPEGRVRWAVTVKQGCFSVNKRLKSLSEEASLAVYRKLEQKYPDEMLYLINMAAQNSANLAFLKRFVKANPILVFDLTPRMTPLMYAVSKKNETGVQYLLEEANKLGIVKEYVNLQVKPDLFGYAPEGYFAENGALGLAIFEDNWMPSVSIVKRLLNAGADPNNGSFLHELIDVYNANIPSVQPHFEIAKALCEAGADPALPGKAPLSALKYAENTLKELEDVNIETGVVNNSDEEKLQNYVLELIKIFRKTKRLI